MRESDVFFLDKTDTGINLVDYGHEVRVGQSVIPLFLNFTLHSFHKSVFSQIVSLTWSDFLQVCGVAREHQWNRISLNFRETKKSHHDLKSSGHQSLVYFFASFEGDELELNRVGFQLIRSFQIHLNRICGFLVATSFLQQVTKTHLHKLCLIFLRQVNNF